MPLHMLLDLNKNIYFRKITAENFLWLFFNNSIFNIFENIILKNVFFILQNYFSEKVFSENRVVEKQSQKVFGYDFSKIHIFI